MEARIGSKIKLSGLVSFTKSVSYLFYRKLLTICCSHWLWPTLAALLCRNRTLLFAFIFKTATIFTILNAILQRKQDVESISLLIPLFIGSSCIPQNNFNIIRFSRSFRSIQSQWQLREKLKIWIQFWVIEFNECPACSFWYCARMTTILGLHGY